MNDFHNEILQSFDALCARLAAHLIKLNDCTAECEQISNSLAQRYADIGSIDDPGYHERVEAYAEAHDPLISCLEHMKKLDEELSRVYAEQTAFFSALDPAVYRMLEPRFSAITARHGLSTSTGTRLQ